MFIKSNIELIKHNTINSNIPIQAFFCTQSWCATKSRLRKHPIFEYQTLRVSRRAMGQQLPPVSLLKDIIQQHDKAML